MRTVELLCGAGVGGVGRCAPAAPRLPAEDLGRARAVLAGAALAGGTLTAARSYDGASRAVTPLG